MVPDRVAGPQRFAEVPAPGARLAFERLATLSYPAHGSDLRAAVATSWLP
jgi:hypothetical protein